MGTKPLLFKYPLDLTGKATTNLVVDEPHTLGADKERAFVPNCGPFYVNNLVVKESTTGAILRPVDQYLVVQPYQEASIRTGLDVAAVIYIIDPAIQTEVLITYQVVGGEFSWSVYALKEMLDALDLDQRPVAWGDIIGKPALYPPTPHLHDLGDTYGWEYIGQQLEGIRDAILTGDAASHDELRQQFQYMIQQVQDQLDALKDQFLDHINDHDNPHQVTKAQIGLSLVENFAVATAAEALAGVLTNRYMTPAGSSSLANRIAQALVDAHANDKNNPHGVTKAQVGLSNVENYRVATLAEAQAGASTSAYMTPYLTAQAIKQIVGDKLDLHLAGMNNPHNTTKAQVGLGSVDNFPTASTVEATTGTATNRFMTPALTKSAIDSQIGTAARAHIADMNNPHNTTKAQVGLGNLPNAITRSRFTNSDTILLTAGGMNDHNASGDHDGRYNPKNTVGVDGSLYVTGGVAYVAVSGGWRQFWPPVWQ